MHQQSPKKYIRTRARKLTIDKCYITNGWQEAGIATVIVTRRHTNGRLTFGSYLVDLYCLGVKDTTYHFNVTQEQLDNIIEQSWSMGMEMTPCRYVVAHNVIYGAVEFAGDYGFRAHKDFGISQFILEEDDEHVELIEYDFGLHGKPCVMVDDDDPQTRVIAQLERTVGKGNYDVIYVGDDYDVEDEIHDEEPLPFEDWSEEDWRALERGEKQPKAIELVALIEMTYESLAREDYTESVDTEAALLIQRYNITDDPNFSGHNVSAAEQAELDDLYHSIHHANVKELKLLIGRVKDNMVKYSRNPVFYNYLTNLYVMSGKPQAAEAVMLETREKFPDYLYGKLNYCMHLITKEKFDKVLDLFNNELELTSLAPDRTKFHLTEARLAFAIISNCYSWKNDVRQADIYYRAMRSLEGGFYHQTFKAIADLTMARLLAAKTEVIKRNLKKAGRKNIRVYPD